MSDVIRNMCRRFKRKWAKEPLAGLTEAEDDEIDACVEAHDRERDEQRRRLP